MKLYKKLLLFMITACFLCCSNVLAADITKYQSCKACGMDREKYNYSRVLVEYGGGSSEGFCSIQCAANFFRGEQ